MSVYGRFKKSKEGFRQLVELLETTPASRRQKMIDVGMKEDADYTLRALQYVMTFEDILKLGDMEIAELVVKAPARTIAMAISPLDDIIKKRFLQNSKPPLMTEIRDYLAVKVGVTEVGGAQLKMVQCARELEKAGKLQIKKIPPNLS